VSCSAHGQGGCSLEQKEQTLRNHMIAAESRVFPVEAVVRPTTIIEARRLVTHLGINITLASETFQHTGSFKFRAAYSVASRVHEDLLITASSGNFGYALAYACSLLKKRCIVVMPTTSAKVKMDAIRECGGAIELVDVRTNSREKRVKELSERWEGAYIASAYDDLLVIEGNGTLGRELGALANKPDVVVVPVGGGGLISGIITGLKQAGANVSVVGAEPLAGNDAARSLRERKIICNVGEPSTIADGARTVSLGKHNWEIIRRSVSNIVEVPEENILKGMRLLFELANLKAEPTGALSIGAVVTQPDLFRGRSVCCIVSGGNVDTAIFATVISV
jgi:threonine dehydratase